MKNSVNKSIGDDLYIEEEITLAKFAERFLNLNDFQTPCEIDVADFGIEVLSHDLGENKDVWKNIDLFVVKPSVDKYYTDGRLKGTSEHEIVEKGEEVFLKNHPDFKEINESMHVVDIAVRDTELYYANERLNHNTTPGGMATRFHASVRIKLLGKTPVKLQDPYVEQQYRAMLEEWKAKGNKGERPVKPKGDEIVMGNDVTARTIKNKLAPPHREAEFRILFGEGVVETESWLDYGIKFGLVTQGGSRYTLNNTALGLNPDIATSFYRKDWLDILSEVEVHDKFKKALLDKMVRPMTPSQELAVEEDVLSAEEVELTEKSDD